MNALILANGELYRPDVLCSRIQAGVFDLVLGVDGGARYACTLGVTLDSVIGDMDSLSDLEREGINNAEFVFYPSAKNETDLELTLLHAKERGVDHIVIVGALGGRIDMTFANIMLLASARLSSLRVEIWHGEQTIWIIKPPGADISGSPGDRVSLIPLVGNILGVTTRGLIYPLEDEEISFGQTRGISNLLEEPSAHVKLSDGLLLAIHIPRQV